MLKFLNYNKKKSLSNLETILSKRKSIQKNKTSDIKKIIFNVKKNGDEAVIKYEKKFSKIKTRINTTLIHRLGKWREWKPAILRSGKT